MTNFDFLKNFNDELYEISAKLEEDVIKSPRAVTADATLFLETLVKDIYRLANKRLDSNLISFYKKVDSLYRQGVITYIYKNKLQDAYNLRNKIHKKNLDSEEEKELAYDLHRRLFYISIKYFRDFADDGRFMNPPEYRKPELEGIHFDNCIICGNSNKKSSSNMCKTCNQKIENANLMFALQNKFEDSEFTRGDLIEYGINESQAILLLMDLSKYNAITNSGEYYRLNPKNFEEYLAEIDQYVEIGLLLTKFYRDEMTCEEIKQTQEYQNCRNSEKPFREFYKLVNVKMEATFERNLLKFRDIAKSMRLSFMDKSEVNGWYMSQKDAFIEGSLNEAFILYNELLIDEFFRLKKKGFNDSAAKKQLGIPPYMYSFWQNHFMEGRFTTKTNQVKKDIILKEIRKGKSLNEAIRAAGVSRAEFEKMHVISQDSNDEFFKAFEREYVHKRQKILIKHLRKHDLNKAIKLARITKNEFKIWYHEGEQTDSEFYMAATELLMTKYVRYRENNWNRNEILKKLNIPKDMYLSWVRRDDLELFRNFENRNRQITSSILKRGLVINGIKEGKTKEEAIFDANLTPKEFMDIYNTSKKENTDFHMRFDMEYEKSRKNRFCAAIQKKGFYEAIQECEMSQAEFNRWYSKDQDMFIQTYNATPFYQITTLELMDKFIRARREGKNQPDAAKSVGLSNSIINKWLNHSECDMFNEFKMRMIQLNIDMIVEGFSQSKSKVEVSEIYDIPLSTIEEFIELGRNGFLKHGEIYELYENRVIPKYLQIFLNDFATKSLHKSLKNAKISKKELDHYCNLAKSGNEKFRDFYDDFLNLKIKLYVDNILSKKSRKIALRNSCLSEEEYRDNEDMIEDMILDGRILIMSNGMIRRKATGVKLANRIGVDVDELYGWYFRGKEGDEKYAKFSKIFELGVIIPRMVSFNQASDIGIPKKHLIKRLKKDLGMKDFKIWEKHGLIDTKEPKIKIDGCGDVDDETLLRMLNETDFLKFCKTTDGRSIEITLDSSDEKQIFKIEL